MALGADPNCSCAHGNTPMHMLMQTNDVNTILDFIRAGVINKLFRPVWIRSMTTG